MLERLTKLDILSRRMLKAHRLESLEVNIKARLQGKLQKWKDLKVQHLDVLGKKFPKLSELREVLKEVGVKDGMAILCNLPLLCIMGALAGSLLTDEILYALTSEEEVTN
jgi:hypothetical protein